MGAVNNYRPPKPEREPNAAALHLEEVKFTATEKTKRWRLTCYTAVVVAVLACLQPRIVGAVSGVVATCVSLWKAGEKK